MDDSVFDMVHAAVTVAREEQIKRLAALRRRLLEIYPGKLADIEAAISFWGRAANT